jgi:F-type H+-transporting ATPase subunit delta
MPLAIANRYSRALGEAVLAPGSSLSADDALTQLNAVAGLLESTPELNHVLRSPAVNAQAKRNVLNGLAAQAGLAPMIRNLLLVVSDHKRIGLFGEIVKGFEAYVDQQRGLVRASITVAAELAESEKVALEAALGKVTGRRVLAEYAVDPGLIGGAVAKVGSTVYDGSVRGELARMRRKLTGE